MDTWVLWSLLMLNVVQNPRPVGDGLDEVTRLRMEARAKLLEEVKIRLEREVEQLALKQCVWAWGEVPWCALQHWQVGAVAGLVLLVLALWYLWKKRSLRREEHVEENDGANEEEVRNVDANEDAAANAANQAVVNDVDEELDGDDDLGRRIMERIQWPVQKLRKGCRMTAELMNHFAIHFQRTVHNSFYPMLQPALGVGSAFEGWSPREQDVVYKVLVAMTAPRGHSFQLELDTAEQNGMRNLRVRVQQECTCMMEQRARNTLCFLHHPEEELRRKQDASLLDTLCTGSYLDVQKTARWLQQLVRAVWPRLRQSRNWHLVLLPSRRSCQFQVSKGRERYRIQVLFGVRQGYSDLFASSQRRHAYTSSTTWPESYAVAEMKFFKYMARQAPPDSLHLKCLQTFSRLQLGLGFSTYTIKTIAMHLLNNLPVSQWRRRHFVRRLIDISETLRTCVHTRRLNHFIVGNRRLPEGIILPSEVLRSEPCNLFHDLLMDPVAHSQAMSRYMDLQERFNRILDSER